MKKLLTLIFALNCAVLSADTLPSKELELIFEKNYLHAEDNLDMLYYMAGQALNDSNSTALPSELVQDFKHYAESEEGRQKFIPIYGKRFSTEDTNEILELVYDDRYMKYRENLAIANFECHQESRKVFEDLVAKKHGNDSHSSSHIKHVTESNFDEILKSSKYVIMDVYADWCGPCKTLAPIFKELNKEYGDKYRFVKMDSDKEMALSKSLRVTGLPTIIFYVNGKEVGREIGFINKEKLLSKIKSYFSK